MSHCQSVGVILLKIFCNSHPVCLKISPQMVDIRSFILIGSLAKICAFGNLSEGLQLNRHRSRFSKVDINSLLSRALRISIEQRKHFGRKNLQPPLSGGTQSLRGCGMLRLLPGWKHVCRSSSRRRSKVVRSTTESRFRRNSFEELEPRWPSKRTHGHGQLTRRP